MTRYFLDSSALVKRYVVETGTTWVVSLMSRDAGHLVLISQITPVEVMSGVMRRQRNREIQARAAHAARLVLDLHCQRDYLVTPIDVDLIQRAEDLLERYPLRAYDAIQLASALESDDALPTDPLTFVSADQRLLSAASAEGLAVEDPNLHP